MRALIGRVGRIERARLPSDWSVWLPLDEEHGDGRVRHVRTGEVADRGEVDRRPGRHVRVEYADGAAPCA
jgi:hypothetical protein